MNYRRLKPVFGPRRAARGFTLTELIIVITILGIIAAIGSQLLSQGFLAYFAGRDITDAQVQGRLAMERMTRDLREIRATADLVIWNATQLSYVDQAGNAVAYTLAGTTLTRNGTPLADGVASLAFGYYQQDGQVAAAPADVRYIAVAINVTQGGVNMNFRTTVHPRNFL